MGDLLPRHRDRLIRTLRARAPAPVVRTVCDVYWIGFEGMDGCGKTTQSRLLAQRLDAALTREPGGTELGARLRAELLHTQEEISPRTEMLLYAADRAHHLDRVVLPALAAGRCVVSDRTVWSSIAYQGHGRRLGEGSVRSANDTALDGRWPDAVVLLTVPFANRTERLQRELDRIERAPESFHRAVEAGFRRLAALHEWIVVDGTLPPERVHELVVDGLAERLGEGFSALLRRDG